MTGNNHLVNLALFRDCFSSSILHRLDLGIPKQQKQRRGKSRKNAVNHVSESATRGPGLPSNNDAEELADFIGFLASEVFDILPPELKGLSYADLQSDSQFGRKQAFPALLGDVEDFVPNIPPSVTDSMEAYGLLSRSTDLSSLVSSAMKEYIATVTAAPPIWSNTRTSKCEICDRGWIPLTYHHLIPRQLHEKALKRNWHDGWRLNSVAWLCRACHSFVHRIASNEELAKELWTVDLLMGRKDIQSWAKWVGRVRWKAR
ncbi:hypothetical protein MMC26_007175 [Xylographa opegraphella]|nr:hypothetical protein [Xylographa opegraphella]